MATRAARTPRERCGLVFLPRDPRTKRVLPVDALQRFAAKCEFDATTGCVLWRGGTTAGRGNSAVYGSFWADDRRWFAHRWAAVHIHGLDIEGLQVGHCCPGRPNTLCVQHLAAQTQADNLAEAMDRLGPPSRRHLAKQSAEQRQFWLFVHKGFEQLDDPAEQHADNDEIPWYEPPEWFRPFMPRVEIGQCPF